MQAGNPDGDFGNYVKIIEYAKLNKRPELLYYYFYHYFEPLLTNDTDDFEKSFSDEERPLMKSIWKKFEVLKGSYGELTGDDLLAKFGIDLNKVIPGFRDTLETPESCSLERAEHCVCLKPAAHAKKSGLLLIVTAKSLQKHGLFR